MRRLFLADGNDLRGCHLCKRKQILRGGAWRIRRIHQPNCVKTLAHVAPPIPGRGVTLLSTSTDNPLRTIAISLHHFPISRFFVHDTVFRGGIRALLTNGDYTSTSNAR
jgi:hypothetical protein